MGAASNYPTVLWRRTAVAVRRIAARRIVKCLLLLALVAPSLGDLKHLRAHGRGPKRQRHDDRPADTSSPSPSSCPFLTDGTCHAGSITKDNYACGSGCGLCAPLASTGCARPCGAWTFKLRGTGGKFMRENVLLALLEEKAVSQDEGTTLGHPQTAARLAEATLRGGATVVLLRDPVRRIMSRCVGAGGGG